jgi:hypothetical protein
MEFASIRGGSERDAWVKKTGSLISRAFVVLSFCFTRLNLRLRRLYGQSKIGNIVISNYYAKTHSDVLVSCALHPGGIRTELQRYLSIIHFSVSYLTKPKDMHPHSSSGWEICFCILLRNAPLHFPAHHKTNLPRIQDGRIYTALGRHCCDSCSNNWPGATLTC